MGKIQRRTLETRARLVAAAEGVIETHGFEALRVEEVVSQAGVAKGTFFAHFPDKEHLMVQLIGARIDAALDRIAALPPPETIDGMVAALTPLMQVMTQERYVFDVIMRNSGAALSQEIGPIAMTFGRFDAVVSAWIADGPFRTDVPLTTLTEGIQAFLMQAMALNFCALHNEVPLQDRLRPYLAAWLIPQSG